MPDVCVVVLACYESFGVYKERRLYQGGIEWRVVAIPDKNKIWTLPAFTRVSTVIPLTPWSRLFLLKGTSQGSVRYFLINCKNDLVIKILWFDLVSKRKYSDFRTTTKITRLLKKKKASSPHHFSPQNMPEKLLVWPYNEYNFVILCYFELIQSIN